MPADRTSILIVDDDADTCEMLPLLLQTDDTKYDIATCTTIATAKNLIATIQFDLFILDYWLSVQNGTELCREIRKTDRTTPILIYSALSHPDARTDAYKAGADVYLVKPNDLERLPISVRDLLRDRPQYVPDSPCGEARSLSWQS